jgi:hypothetical protein
MELEFNDSIPNIVVKICSNYIGTNVFRSKGIKKQTFFSQKLKFSSAENKAE